MAQRMDGASDDPQSADITHKPPSAAAVSKMSPAERITAAGVLRTPFQGLYSSLHDVKKHVVEDLLQKGYDPVEMLTSVVDSEFTTVGRNGLPAGLVYKFSELPAGMEPNSPEAEFYYAEHLIAQMHRLREPDYENWVEHNIHLPKHDCDVRAIHSPDHDGKSVMLLFGEPQRDMLVRLQSSCIYGEVFDSDDCDCGPQLDRSMEVMAEEGTGAVIYVLQEGRGMGLLAKALGYRESQASGADTFKAYLKHGLIDDYRSYLLAIEMLDYLNIDHFRLATNNPYKEAWVRAGGFDPRLEPVIPRTQPPKNLAKYLEAKRRSGHLLPVFDTDE